MFKSIVRFGFLLLLLFVVFVMMLSAGWLKIIVNGPEISSDIRNIGNGLPPQQKSVYENRKSFDENRLFKFVPHVVSPGETLFDLERSYGTNWKVIQRVNKIDDPFRLTVGAIIRIPVRIVDS